MAAQTNWASERPEVFLWKTAVAAGGKGLGLQRVYSALQGMNKESSDGSSE